MAPYRERTSHLDGAVVWSGTAPAAAPREASVPVLPDGCMDLLWIGGALLVAGPDTRAFTPEGLEGLDCAGVRFAPGDAPALLGVPAHELRDRRVPLDALWPAARVRRLADEVAAGRDPAAALETVALRLAADRPPPDPLLRAVAAGLGAGHTVARTAEVVGLGARHLHRRSLAAFGYGPKTLARILRLQRALALLREGVPAARAATRSGCADQAHLAREVRALTGLTPGGYAALVLPGA